MSEGTKQTSAGSREPGATQQLNLDGVPDAEERFTLPAGSYLCECRSVEGKESKAGDPYWEVTFVIVEGKFVNLTVEDSVHFTEGALPRLKLILKRMGVEVPGGGFTLDSRSLERKQVVLDVEIEKNTFTTKAGKEITVDRNKVAFSGYHEASMWEAIKTAAAERTAARQGEGAAAKGSTPAEEQQEALPF